MRFPAVKMQCASLRQHGVAAVQVAEANAEQVERKKAMQAREVEEEARIADYNRAKALREVRAMPCLALAKLQIYRDSSDRTYP
jgi:hypothetical protein